MSLFEVVGLCPRVRLLVCVLVSGCWFVSLFEVVGLCPQVKLLVCVLM